MRALEIGQPEGDPPAAKIIFRFTYSCIHSSRRRYDLRLEKAENARVDTSETVPKQQVLCELARVYLAVMPDKL